jgi:hypothetical protein
VRTVNTLSYPSGAFTISMWVKLAPGANEGFLALAPSAAANSVISLGHWSSLELFVRRVDGTSVNINTGYSIRDNIWHHIAVVGSPASTDLRIYVDGGVKGSRSDFIGGLQQIANCYLFLGVREGSYPGLDVAYDNVRLYGSALNVASVVSQATENGSAPVSSMSISSFALDAPGRAAEQPAATPEPTPVASSGATAGGCGSGAALTGLVLALTLGLRPRRRRSPD